MNADGQLVAIVTTRTYVYRMTLPHCEQITSVTFAKGPNMSLLGTVNLAPQADTTITSRPVAITFDVGDPVTVDMINPAATFAVPAGATKGVATPTGSVNPVGTGPAGVPFSFDIPVQPTVPPAEVVQSVTFSPAS